MLYLFCCATTFTSSRKVPGGQLVDIFMKRIRTGIKTLSPAVSLLSTLIHCPYSRVSLFELITIQACRRLEIRWLNLHRYFVAHKLLIIEIGSLFLVMSGRIEWSNMVLFDYEEWSNMVLFD